MPNEKKRKAVTVSDVLPTQNVQSVAAPSPTQAAARRAIIGGAAWEEGADADEVVEVQVDELICTVSSEVVGVQYYKGRFLFVRSNLGLTARQVLLASESKFASSENRTTHTISKSRADRYWHVNLTCG
jgi:hypothetical protein